MSVVVLSERDIARFWSKVDIRGPDECWPFLAYRDKNGYGSFAIRGRSVQAARVAWWIHTGMWPAVVRHKVCDNPPCCNFAHLLDGTHADNNRDMTEKGRQKAHGALPTLRGKGNASAKLTDVEVLEIRARWPGETQLFLALEYQVSESLIWAILHRKVWEHL